jgi:hypothetical protein
MLEPTITSPIAYSKTTVKVLTLVPAGENNSCALTKKLESTKTRDNM